MMRSDVAVVLRIVAVSTRLASGLMKISWENAVGAPPNATFLDASIDQQGCPANEPRRLGLQEHEIGDVGA